MNFFEKALELKISGKKFASITLLSHKGHAPQDDGAKALVTDEGLFWGTVGGGKVEAKAIQTAKELLNTENKIKCSRIHWNLQRDVGMTCGGEVEFLFEIFENNPWTVYVFGAGHVAQSLVRLLLTLDLKITCFDHRNEWLEKLPQGHSNLSCSQFTENENPENYVPWNPSAYYLVLTQGHSTDLPILERVLKQGMPQYIGVIGSPVKSVKIKKALYEMGISLDSLEKLHCPMGLPIGNNDPNEIAISITAELLKCRDENKVLLQP